MTAALRAHAALRDAGLSKAGRLERASNSSREVWFVGRYVLFINPRPDRSTLLHRAKVLQCLPKGIRASTFVNYGTASFGEWLVETRINGHELSRIWGSLTDTERQHAITSLGLELKELHAVDAVACGLGDADFLWGDTLDCPHQLPVGRLLDLLSRVNRLPFVDRAVTRQAVDMVLALSSALDEEPRNLVHGDLHFENVLCDGPRLGLIDFEWSRAGPPDLDLDVLLHSLADPALHVHGTDRAELHRRDFEHVTTWLRAAYPELFAHPRLVDRLTVYRLAYDTRALLQDPPDRPVEQLSPHHPINRIRRLVEGRSELRWMLAG